MAIAQIVRIELTSISSGIKKVIIPVNAKQAITASRAMLNHLTILVCFCKNLPSGMDKSNPVNAGMEVSIPTWKDVALR